MNSVASTPYGVGCPIRTFPDQSLLATPRNLSQRATSFIASQCQGIHQMLLSYLILIRSQIFYLRTFRPSTRKGRGVQSALCADMRCVERSPSGRYDTHNFLLTVLLAFLRVSKPGKVWSTTKRTYFRFYQLIMVLSMTNRCHFTNFLHNVQEQSLAANPRFSSWKLLSSHGNNNRAGLVELDGIEPTTSSLQS